MDGLDGEIKWMVEMVELDEWLRWIDQIDGLNRMMDGWDKCLKWMG